ncbi:MAG: hypothetical protein JSV16_13475 [Candidatus Hydrogenedentota bacterium]|nr:MAG: hypothetical protein JSV16_13475 [Candidatus Hydrogenedentota bacterium]
MFGQKAAGSVAYMMGMPTGRSAIAGIRLPRGDTDVSPLRAPVSGIVAGVNQKVLDSPGLLETVPCGEA